MRLSKLREKRDSLYDYLEDINYQDIPETVKRARKSDVNYEIACIEEVIDLEMKLRPLKIVIIGFITVAAILAVYFLLKK